MKFPFGRGSQPSIPQAPKPQGSTPFVTPPSTPQLSPMIGAQRPGAKPGGPPILGQHRGATPMEAPKAKFLKTIGTVEAVDKISGAGAHPIWLITCSDGEQFIVKSEATHVGFDRSAQQGFTPNWTQDMRGEAARLQAASDIMIVASPNAATEVLEAGDVWALKNYIASTAPNTLPVSELADAINAMGMGGSSLIAKMKFDSTFFASTREDVERMNDKDKKKTKELLIKLRKNQLAWSSLGEVIIADFIIANGDRIDCQGGEWGVANFGNLIFSKDPKTGKLMRALGFDILDPGAVSRGNLHLADISSWEAVNGYAIRDPGTFPAAAQMIMDDIYNKRLAPLKMSKFLSEVDDLAGGMRAGWEKQKSRVQSLVARKSNVPVGLLRRAQYLRWI